MKTVLRAFLRYLPRRRGLTLLQLLGIVCGVAAVTGMTLSAGGALSGISRAAEFLGGKATHSLERPAGPMDEQVLAQLMLDPAVQAFSPVLDRSIRLPGGEPARFMGLDPFLDREIRAGLSWTRPADGAPRDLATQAWPFLLDERAVLMEDGLARRLGLSRGSVFATNRGELRLLGTFPNPSGEPLVVMDIAHAQKALGLQGLADRVDLILADEAGFRSRWERGFVISSGRQRRETMSAMLGAFRLNLQALSLLALFVGVFLIYNTAMFAVVSRRRDAGILRSLGATRTEVAAAFLSEILLLGLAGGALGGAGGWALARFLIVLIGRTVSDLYFFLSPEPPAWSWLIPAAGALLGSAAALLSSAFPLAELVRQDPAAALQGRAPSREGRARALRAAAAGAVVMAGSLVLLVVPGTHVYVGFAGAFGFLIGSSLMSGGVLIVLAPALNFLLGAIGGLPGRVAAGYIHRNLGRTAVAAAAFMVALSMSVGLSSMIGSFRHTLLWWMDTQLQADLYIGHATEAVVPEDLYREVKALPGIEGVDVYRNVRVLYRGLPVFVAAVDSRILQRFTHFGWLEGGNENWDPVKEGAAIVSESFSRRFGVKAGERVTLDGLRGPAELPVAAVFYDYTSEHGLIMIDRDTYTEVFGDRTVNTIGVFAERGPRGERAIGQARRLGLARGLLVQDRSTFHGSILAVFESTFAVTRSMRVLAIVIALFGIAGALLTLFMERQREFGIYRALGFSSAQAAGMTVLEGLALGLVSLLMGLAGGTGLALILIKVINLKSFNWTIFYCPSWEPYLTAAATALAAGLLASAWPAWRIYTTYPQRQLRDE